MNILITGGAGYVGYALVQRLLQRSNTIENITVYDNLSRKNYALFSGAKIGAGKLTFVPGELLDGRTLARVAAGADAVVHLAAKVTTPFADNEAHFFDQVNHWGTAQLVQAVCDAPRVKKLLYLSSVSVYGNHPEPVNEQTPPHPDSFYGHAKLRGEEQLVRLPESCETYVLRAGNVYGFNPAMRLDAVVNRFVFEAHFQGRITLHGNGEQARPFIQVDKLTGLLAGLLEQPYGSGLANTGQPDSGPESRALPADVSNTAKHQRALPPGIYNAVEHNFTVREIAQAVAQVYPELERHTINQHLAMKSLRVQVPCVLTQALPLPERSFADEIRDFGAHFAF
jgi:UDP-glucose 4-epimerase